MPISNQISNYLPFKYIVTGSEPGPFHTIQSALDYVNALAVSTTVFVRPGTYTEDLTLYSGINIQGSEEGQVIIIGTHTPPAAGTFTISKCTLQSATDVFTSVAAGTTTLTTSNCTFKVTAGYVFNLAGWTGDLIIDDCLEQSTANDIINNSGNAAVEIMESVVGTAGGTGMVASGIVRLADSRIFCGLVLSGAASIDACTIGGVITITGTADISINNSYIETGAAAAINTITTGQVTISDTTILSSAVNVIIGTSDVELASVTFLDGEGIAGVTVVTDSELRCNHAYATEAMTILKGDFNLIDGALNINSTSGTNGQVLLGNTATSKPIWASLTAGANITLTPGANSLTIASTGGSAGLIWAGSAGTAIVANHGYIVNTNSLQTFTLPATPTVGDTYAVTSWAGYGASNAWKITNDANHSIQIGNVTVGSGTSYIQSSAVGDCITLVCVYDSGGGVYSFSATAVIGNITMNP